MHVRTEGRLETWCLGARFGDTHLPTLKSRTDHPEQKQMVVHSVPDAKMVEHTSNIRLEASGTMSEESRTSPTILPEEGPQHKKYMQSWIAKSKGM